MKIIRCFSFVLLILSFSRCTENDIPRFCNVTSIDELTWLKDEIDSNGLSNTSATMDVQVYSANYVGMEVIYLDLCCVNCLVTPPKVRTCNGTDLGFLGSEVNENLVINRKVIWRTQNGFCE